MKYEELSDWEHVRIIAEHMLELGVPVHLSGYGYLREAILISSYDMSVVNSVTKLLYPVIAKSHNTTTAKIERSIWSAIEVSWERGKTSVFEELFGYSRDTGQVRPTNSEYIARVADMIRMEMNLK